MVIVQLQRWIKICGPGVQELSGRRISRQETGHPDRPDPSDQSATLLKTSLFTLSSGLSSGSDFL